MSHEDRERKFEQALQRHWRRDAAGARNEADAQAVPDEAVGAAECLDAATLAAFHENMLSNEEMKATTEHIAGCSRCQQILLLLEVTDEIPLQIEAEDDLRMRESVLSAGALHAGTQRPGLAGHAKPAMKTPTEISRGRGFKALRWAAPAGAIAAGLLIWLVVRDNKVQNSHFENVQVAQQQSTEERPATPQALPALPAPEPTTKITQLNEKRKDDTKAKQPAKESAALRAHMEAPSATIANEVGVAADRLSTRANDGQLQAKPKNFSSRETVENKPPEIVSRHADVSTTAAPAAAATAPAPSRDQRAQSAAPADAAGKTVAIENANAASTFETDTGGTNQLIPTQQVATNDKLEPPAALKKVGFGNGKIILAPTGAVAWRVGAAGRLEQSVDNGATWVRQNGGVKAELLAGSAPSEAVCWIVGRSGTVLRTTDGGGHWSKVVSPMGGDIAGVQAADAMTAEIFDAKKSSRFLTHDGGATWQATKQ
ncbi:MAG TPA: YCF48-related protein [Verrucomicrobiae bacterium]|jgi:hypothetical protein|nr:YCF48-related protein [Verrucomicrobiae bacterium]